MKRIVAEVVSEATETDQDFIGRISTVVLKGSKLKAN